jgi:uncharacterized protein
MDVVHKPEEWRFVLEVGGREAELTYFTVDDNTLDYNHTFVPPDLRGSGAGGKVVRAALDYARKHGFSVRPTCSFVRAFAERHPEYEGIITS